MSDLIVSQDVDNFMQSANATTALASISGLSVSGGTVKGDVSVTGSLSISNSTVTINSTGVNINAGKSLNFGGVFGSISPTEQDLYPNRLTANILHVTNSFYANKYYENLTPLSAKYAPYTTYTTLNTISGNIINNITGYVQGSLQFEDYDGVLTNVSLQNLGVLGDPTFRNVTVNVLTATNANVTNALTANSVSVNTLTANSVNINTLTATTVTITTLTAVNANINSLTAREVISDVNIGNITTTKTFSYSADNSKIFNFNTTSGSISAIFPGSLPNGFNVGITNIGTNTVYISSTQVNNLCATSNKNSTQFSGIYIYKTNNALYGIGRFS